MRRLLIGVSRKIEYSLRADFFSHLQGLDPTFFENNRTGNIMALISNDLDAVRNFLGPGIMNFFNTVFVFVSTLAVMFTINVKLTLFALVAVPLLPVIVYLLSSQLYKTFKISQEHYAFMSARTQESIAGIKVVKSFTQEANEVENFADINRQYIKKNMDLARVRSIFWPLMILIGGIGSLVVFLVGGRQVINGVLTLGQFVQFSAYILSITWPLISLGWVINLIQRGEVSMGRLNKVFDMRPDICEPDKPVSISKIKGDISFKNVSFAYPKQESYESYESADAKGEKKDTSKKKPSTNPGGKAAENKSNSTGPIVLNNISFEIAAGTRTGIAGFTGSGKSTLVNLIPRLYDVSNGSVTVDGIDLRKMPLKTLRTSIAYVTQDAFIFSKTIRENIIFGKEEELLGLPQEELENKIIRASKIAHLHEDVATFPEGYDTIVGERGITLSGGQKQRLAIARAIITEPEILILDDSFSSVDTNTEELILSDIKKATKNLTVIIISHRISTIKDSDQIIVMDEGTITETGTHSQLLKISAIYQKLYKRQQLSDELHEEL
jgi:ATP-binding cassette subfamily B protein